jgi:hypothetical protein
MVVSEVEPLAGSSASISEPLLQAGSLAAVSGLHTPSLPVDGARGVRVLRQLRVDVIEPPGDAVAEERRIDRALKLGMGIPTEVHNEFSYEPVKSLPDYCDPVAGRLVGVFCTAGGWGRRRLHRKLAG